MSGTSLDGIDIVYVKFQRKKSWNYKIIHAETFKYDEFWKQKLKSSQSLTKNGLKNLNENYTKLLASKIEEFINKKLIENIDFIGSHGHTIFHKPSKGYTFQIGNLDKLSSYLRRTVICDFRTRDVELGGQ